MIKIDGQFGEGGGQIVRSSLTMSMITGRAFLINNIRARRRRKGLLRQHLTCLNATRQICDAKVSGAEIGSSKFTFKPCRIKGGNYHFEIGSAGSTMLVLQTILPALIMAERESNILISGGTHAAMAPPFDFIQHVYLEQLKKLGAEIELKLNKYGFYPAGGGEIVAKIKPIKILKPLDIVERGCLINAKITGIVANLSKKIAEREVNYLTKYLDNIATIQTEILDVMSNGPGNVVMVDLEFENSRELITGFGKIGVSRKTVARETLAEVERFLINEVPVGEHLADQLLIPLVITGKGQFVTSDLSLHALTNIEVIKRFVDKEFMIEELSEKFWKISLENKI